MVVNIASLTSMVDAVAGAGLIFGRGGGACAWLKAAHTNNVAKITLTLSLIFAGIRVFIWRDVFPQVKTAQAGS
jgi:hypothetical protein